MMRDAGTPLPESVVLGFLVFGFWFLVAWALFFGFLVSKVCKICQMSFSCFLIDIEPISKISKIV